MKRSEIIKLLEQTGSLMDAIDGTVLKDKKTGKTVGTIDIHGACKFGIGEDNDE